MTATALGHSDTNLSNRMRSARSSPHMKESIAKMTMDCIDTNWHIHCFWPQPIHNLSKLGSTPTSLRDYTNTNSHIAKLLRPPSKQQKRLC